jgi:fructoselysine-6-P-deglycase FrlB-like protein
MAHLAAEAKESGMVKSYLDDVLAQPGALRLALDAYRERGFPASMRGLRGFERVIFAGTGLSRHACHGAAIHLADWGVDACVKSAGELFQYEWNLVDEACLLVLVSPSGEEPELLALLEGLPPGANIAAITAEPESSLGRRAGALFPLCVEGGESLPTRSYLASWVLASMLARAIAGDSADPFIGSVGAAMDSLDALLGRTGELGPALARFFGQPGFLCYLGKGHSYSSVFGGALVTSRFARCPAMGFDPDEFGREGPGGEGGSCNSIIFAPEGAAYAENCRMAGEIASRGGKALLVTDLDPGMEGPGLMTVDYAPVGEAFSPLVDIALAQLSAVVFA